MKFGKESAEMRLFTAILLEKSVVESLCAAEAELSRRSAHGNFTRRENLHLTLNFLGESTRVAAVWQAMEKVSRPAFQLRVKGLGRFRRSGGDLWWAGVEPCPPLLQLQKELADGLRTAGFSLEDRDYRPHLTLGREVVLSDGVDPRQLELLPETEMRVRRVSLMRSDRLNGRLTYTELFSHPLE